MKKILAFAMLLFLSAGAYAQKEVTKFLGIPVDGTKAEMIQKLKQKGFTWNSTYNCLEGEFNGRKVNIFVSTNNNKVWRIGIGDQISCDEGQIKIRFNDLCRQFEKNKRYTSFLLSDQFLSDSEDISYEISVHDKQYQAIFYQLSENDAVDSTDFLMRPVWFTIGKVYGKYFIMMYYENEYNKADGEDL